MVQPEPALFLRTKMTDSTEQHRGVEELQDILEENLELTKENHKILKRMERNALIGFFAKVFLWLLVLGVPILFLGPYLKPLFSLMSQGTTGSSTPSGIFGLPSASQLEEIVNSYKTK